MGNQIFEESHSPKIKMSDREESPVAEVPEAEEVEVSGDAASKGQMSVLDALKGVLKLALMHDGLARGLREASKALDRRQAHVCVLVSFGRILRRENPRLYAVKHSNNY